MPPLPFATGALISGVMVVCAAALYGILADDLRALSVAIVAYTAGTLLALVVDLARPREDDR